MISVLQRGRKKNILDSDIIMITAYSNYSEIFLENGDKYFTSKTLKYWSEKIYDNNFIRIHQSFYINLNHIQEIDKKDKIIRLSNGLVACISRSKWSQIKRMFDLDKKSNKIKGL